MVGARFRLTPELFRFRRLRSWLGSVALPLAAWGCTMPMSDLVDQGPPLPRPAPTTAPVAVRPAPVPLAALRAPAITTASFRVDAPELPPPTPVAAGELAPALESVLRLADEKNPQIARARLSVQETETAEAVAEHSHLPDHCRDEAFRRRSAEAHVWQQRVELSRVRNEVLQDTGNACIDLLTARRSEAITVELEQFEKKLLGRARALARDEKSAQSLVEGLETSVAGRRHTEVRQRQQAEAAAARLAYLVNSGGAPPLPAELALAPVDLIDATRPAEALVQQSLETGPGVAELAGLQAALEKVVESAHFLQAACNRTGCVAFCGRLQVAQDKVAEVRLARDDQAGKLRMGVIEARSAILSGREQIALASDQVRHAAEAYRLANVRLDDMLSVETLGQAQQSIHGLEAAHFAYLQAVSAYDKAEVRLELLLGWPNGCPHPAP